MFTISYDKQGYAHIKNSSGKYLGVTKSRAVSGANVKQYRRNDSLAQKWIIIKRSNGSYRIQSALWENLSLDVDGGLSAVGTNVQVCANNSTAAQRWTFKTPAAAAKAAAKAEAAAAKEAQNSKKITLRGTVKQSYQGISLRTAKAAGIDVSVWNGDINWYKVAASGVRFAIIRCGYGSDFASQDDVKFLQNVKGARAAGLDIGVYLYSHATNTTGARSEAAHTLRLLKAAGLTPAKVKYGVYYDIEEADQYDTNMAPVCDEYCSIIKSAGYKAGVYSSLSWWNSRLYSVSFNKWNRWVAQWPPKTGSQECSYSGSYKIWQCMSDGVVPGIVGRVDMNLAY